MHRDFLLLEMASLEDAGIDVRPLRGGRRPLFRIETEDDEASLVVWSYLDVDRCFIEPMPRWTRGEGHRTQYPTGYFHRLVSDEDRRPMLGFVAIALMPLLLAFAFRIYPGVPLLILLAAVVLGAVVGFYYWWGDEREWGFEFALHRLVLGTILGLLWVAAVGAIPSAITILGAVWVFLGSNLVWASTIGIDRWLTSYAIAQVGERMSREKALKRLDEMRDRTRGPASR